MAFLTTYICDNLVNTFNWFSVDKEEGALDAEEGELPPDEQDDLKPEEGKPGADEDRDERSVFVKNVDYSADEASLREHFKFCGDIASVHIRKNFQTQQPLG